LSGSATLGTNLIDDLVPTIDDLRGDLNADFGTRQWRVYVVRRTWNGGERGRGSYVETQLEITPPPLVSFDEEERLLPEGRDEEGTITLTEVSLTYTADELLGGNIPAHVEAFYRLDDQHGQGTGSQYYVPKKPPAPDRENGIGWKVVLLPAEVPA